MKCLASLALACALSIPSGAGAAPTGTTTQNIRTAAPANPINLAGQTASDGGSCSPSVPGSCACIQANARFSLSGTLADVFLANSGVTAGTYGDAFHSLTMAVDAKGRVTSVSTNSISGGGADGQFYGDGSSGALTCSGLQNLSKPTYYTNLTLQAGCQIITNGSPIFVSGTLTMDNAPTDSIISIGGTGGTGNTGPPGPAPLSGFLGGGNAGGTGGTRGATTTCGLPTNSTGLAVRAGGGGGNGQVGTGCANQTQGIGDTGGSISNLRALTTGGFMFGAALVMGGSGGGGGQSGAGDGVHGGGGGGGGGAGGGVLAIYAHTVSRTTGGTQACVIDASAGAGGAGGTPQINGSGGSGGGGGGGGWVYMVYGTLNGTAAVNVLCADSGAGGAGSDGIGTGGAGVGGESGFGGVVTKISTASGTVTSVDQTAARNLHSGAVGGAAIQARASL